MKANVSSQSSYFGGAFFLAFPTGTFGRSGVDGSADFLLTLGANRHAELTQFQVCAQGIDVETTGNNRGQGSCL